MKRVFSHPLFVLAVGLVLRLTFVLKLPSSSGDAVLYEQFAANWLRHHIYGMTVDGVLTPVDLRMPGYPAYLAIVYAITRHTGEAARLFVMLGQTAVDLIACLAIVCIAAKIVYGPDARQHKKRAVVAALWLSALCPFTANYVAVPLTETFAIAFTAAAILFLCMIFRALLQPAAVESVSKKSLTTDIFKLSALAGLSVGMGTLFRPETPLLLVTAWLVLAIFLPRQRKTIDFLRIATVSGLACVAPLIPWTIRNAVTLHEFQPLTPKYSTLPGEITPYGFMKWESTWLYRFRDVYLVSWKLNDEAIPVETISSKAFDSTEEQQQVVAILEKYNDDLTLTEEEDRAFGEIARERIRRHPFRTYLYIPFQRAITIWFTPRIEQLPISGTVFPFAQSWEDDSVDMSVTIGFFFLNLAYIALALWGGIKLWRANREGRAILTFFLLYIFFRTAFLTTLETPEPRYVLVCFPIIIALAANAFRRKHIA